MKNRDIYDTALCLIDEPDDDLRLENYAARAPYILGGFLCENSSLDDKYREFTGQSRETAIVVPAELDGEFPLSERFVSVAANYLAAMLVCDSDSDLSDKLLELHKVSLDKILVEITPDDDSADNGNTDSAEPDENEEVICGESHGIVNVYGSIT